MIGAAIGAAAGLLGGIIGGSAAKRNAKRARAILDKQDKDNEAWGRRKMNEDYTMTSENQAALNKSRELARELVQGAEGRAAVMGATDESVALAKKGANDAIAEATTAIAANATAAKNAAESQYLATKANIANQKVNTYMNQAQQSAAAGSQAMGAGMGLVGADLQSHLGGSKGLFESLFKKG